jgi:hypothetical protein
VAPALRAEGPVRRCDRGRGIAWPRDRLLPRQEPRRQERRRAREELHRLGRGRRNTTILRSNYKTPEGARFYDASVKLYEGLSQELNFNLLFSQCGHLTLAHSDRALS